MHLLRVYCLWAGPLSVSRAADAGVVRALVTMALQLPAAAGAGASTSTPLTVRGMVSQMGLQALLLCTQRDADAGCFAARVPGVVDLVTAHPRFPHELPSAAVGLPFTLAAAVDCATVKRPADEVTVSTLVRCVLLWLCCQCGSRLGCLSQRRCLGARFRHVHSWMPPPPVQRLL